MLVCSRERQTPALGLEEEVCTERGQMCRERSSSSLASSRAWPPRSRELVPVGGKPFSR